MPNEMDGWMLRARAGDGFYYAKRLSGREAFVFFSMPATIADMKSELAAVDRRLMSEIRHEPSQSA